MICIAGKNQCAVDALNYLITNPEIDNKNICICSSQDDKGIDSWQPSFKKFAAKNNIQEKKLKDLYDKNNLIFFSLEFDKIINVMNFKSKKLYNFHFSLLPKYRGCHTNYLQIKNGESHSGVTCHKIDNGIDTGEIIDCIKYSIKLNDTSMDNYFKLMSRAFELFKKQFYNLCNETYISKKQDEKNASYFSRAYIDYKNENIDFNSNLNEIHNQIRALIFPPYQLPEVNGKKIIKSKLFDDHIILTDINHNEQIYK